MQQTCSSNVVGKELLWTAILKRKGFSAVQEILSRFPNAVREFETSFDWRKPLLQACRLGLEIEVIGLLVDAYPQSLEKGITEGDELPLHASCRQSGSGRVIPFLIDRSPQALKELDYDGNLPLHLAFLNASVSMANVLNLVKAYPAGLWTENNEGKLPLSEAPLDVVFQVLRSCPAAVLKSTMMEGHRNVPEKEQLWFAITKRKGLATVRDILRRFPGVVGSFENSFDWRKPLLQSCRMGLDVEIVELLADACPEALKKGVAGEDHPLHAACMAKTSYERVICLLIQRCPSAVRLLDYYGNLPLHLLCKSSPASRNMMVCLATEYPEGVWTANNEGRLPLQEVSLDTLFCILRSCPQAASMAAMKYGHRRIPGKEQLWTAISNGDDSGTIRRILREFPGVVREFKQTLDWRNPLLKACQIGLDASTIELLVDADHEGMRNVMNGEEHPLHAACRKEGGYEAVISLLIDRCPEALSLADYDGNLPLHIASRWASPSVTMLVQLVCIYPEATRVVNHDDELPFANMSSETVAKVVELCEKETSVAIVSAG